MNLPDTVLQIARLRSLFTNRRVFDAVGNWHLDMNPKQLPEFLRRSTGPGSVHSSRASASIN